MNKAQQPPAGSVRRGRLFFRHRDHGYLPILGNVESLRADQSWVMRDHDQSAEICASCGRAIPGIEGVHSICMSCTFPMCGGPDCGQVHCAEETCGQAVCARCRRRIGETEEGKAQYLCLPHFDEWERERIVIGIVVVLGAAILAGVLFFWMR